MGKRRRSRHSKPTAPPSTLATGEERPWQANWSPEARERLTRWHAELDASAHHPSQIRKRSDQVMSEEEIMGLIFAAQSDLSIELDWSTIRIGTPSSAFVDKTAKPRTVAIAADGRHHALDHHAQDFDFDPPGEQPAARSSWQIHTWHGKAWANHDGILERAQIASSASPLAQLELDDHQSALLARAPKRMPTLNVRYFDRERAMAMVVAFVARGRLLHRTHLRIITGKGIGSTTGAVLRPAIVQWCALEQSAGRLNWAPELDDHHEFGAVIIEVQK